MSDPFEKAMCPRCSLVRCGCVPPDTCDLPAIPQSTSDLRTVCAKYDGSLPQFFVTPAIPLEKQHNARSSLHLPPDDQIVALLDLTIFGSAKNAVAISSSGIYWKNHDEAQHISWPKFRAFEVTAVSSGLTKIIKVGPYQELNLTGLTGTSDVQGKLVALLNELRSVARIDDSIDPSATSTNLAATCADRTAKIGFVNCEFCAELLKPNVTYCKHCGIRQN